jgi:hypothetical protein
MLEKILLILSIKSFTVRNISLLSVLEKKLYIDKIDLEIAESRMNDPQQDPVGFDEFFADLED